MYEDALKFEEVVYGNVGRNSDVTGAYLQKVKEKLVKLEEMERRKCAAAGGAGSLPGALDNVIRIAGEKSVDPTIMYSIATDKQRLGLASGLQTNNE